jgi:hypothetical protein
MADEAAQVEGLENVQPKADEEANLNVDTLAANFEQTELTETKTDEDKSLIIIKAFNFYKE